MRGALSVRAITQAGAGWMPAVGNTAVAAAFAIALVLNASLTGGSDLSIFTIAPLLLLLSQDALLLTELSDKRRYAPLAAAVSAYLAASCAAQLHAGRFASVGLVQGAASRPWSTAKNALGLCMTLPSHGLFVRFLWSHARQPEVALLAALPLNLPPLFLADMTTLQLLGGLGLAAAAAQFGVSRHVADQGKRYI